jgi:hypothetical protein
MEEREARLALKREIINRICGEFLEMPGLGLKREQARRLWHVDDEFCGEILDFLVSPASSAAGRTAVTSAPRPPRKAWRSARLAKPCEFVR